MKHGAHISLFSVCKRWPAPQQERKRLEAELQIRERKTAHENEVKRKTDEQQRALWGRLPTYRAHTGVDENECAIRAREMANNLERTMRAEAAAKNARSAAGSLPYFLPFSHFSERKLYIIWILDNLGASRTNFQSR